jgi:mannose-1-phosphate guanylyltransferase
MDGCTLIHAYCGVVMRIVLLSGGNGRRLWPLSNDSRSKQFLKLLKAPDGGSESMLQRVYRQIREAGIKEKITIATCVSQRDSIIDQLGDAVDIVLEPERRDTFPAIVLVSAYLGSVRGCSGDEVVVIMPVDPYTESAYFNMLPDIAAAVENSNAELALMGVTPTYPSEKYGYIVPLQGQNKAPFSVGRFTEKPTEAEALRLIEQGAVWNGGVFAFKLGYLLDIAHSYLGQTSYEHVYNDYGKLPKISFDYAVAEKAKNVLMLPFTGEWKDLGTWNTLVEALDGHITGNAVIGESATGTYVINELDVPVITLGLSDIIVAACPDGILVCSKESSSRLKQYVDLLKRRNADK